jgi:hypothetical protein
MPFLGFQTPTETVLTKEIARQKLRAERAERGRDRLAHLVIYKELRKDEPFLSVVRAQLLGAGYTAEEVTALLEETKREYKAEH